MGKYLGLPEHFGRKKKDLFSSIVDKMKQRTLNWSTQFLSTAGKATMIQSVLSPIPSYAMSCFELPVSLCKRIQTVLTRFWWDSSDGTRKICWISWDKMTQPKDMGGLGFRDIQTFNHALLAKIGWRLHTNPDCLLAKVLMGKYCHKTTFQKAQANSSISHGWRGILRGRDLLVEHLGKAIGDGESTSVWNDSWIDPATNLKPVGPVLLKDKDLMVSDLLTRGTREWNSSLVENILPELKDHILKLRPSVLRKQDTYVWPLQQNGEYSVKSGYYSTFLSTDQTTGAPIVKEKWKKLIWTRDTSPKLKYFLWKVGANALPTGENLRKRGMLLNNTCIRCGAPETIDHILFHCQFAIDVWTYSSWEHPIDTSLDTSLFEKLEESWSNTPLPPYGFKGNPFPWWCWFIWIARNQLIFENRAQSPKETALTALLALKEWEAAQPPRPQTSNQRPLQQPQASPNRSEIYCNTDASWSPISKEAGLAWIFMDSEAIELNRGFSKQTAVSSSCMGEALAIREALLQAASRNYPNICIRTDSQVLTQAITSCRHTMELYGVLSPISTSFPFLHLLLSLVVVSFSFLGPTMGLLTVLQRPVLQTM